LDYAQSPSDFNVKQSWSSQFYQFSSTQYPQILSILNDVKVFQYFERLGFDEEKFRDFLYFE